MKHGCIPPEFRIRGVFVPGVELLADSMATGLCVAGDSSWRMSRTGWAEKKCVAANS